MPPGLVDGPLERENELDRIASDERPPREQGIGEEKRQKDQEAQRKPESGTTADGFLQSFEKLLHTSGRPLANRNSSRLFVLDEFHETVTSRA